ncbi:MAG: M14 family zinc carboxypeptidase [Parvicellaceae bacterium]
MKINNRMNISRIYIVVFLMIVPFFIFSQNIDKIFESSGEVHFSFDYHNKKQLDKLSKIISIDHQTNNIKAYAYANKTEFENFLNQGIDYNIINDKRDLKSPDNKRSNWDFYPSYPQYVSMMEAFADSFPSICKLHNIGTLSSGHQILIAQISNNVGVKENEPSFLYTSSMHGDELTGYILMLRLIDEMLNGYGTNIKYTNLINSVDIWINPLANPDGAYAGGDNSIQGATRYNANWVDLNRNYPDPLAGDHPDGNVWQEETIIFMDLADSIPFNMSCNLHTGAEVFNYPWDTWSNLAADDSWWQYIATIYADTVHQHSPGYFTDLNNGITNGWDWYEVDGGRQDFMNYFKLCREATLELSSNKIPNPITLPDYWNYNGPSLVNYIEQSLFGLRGLVTDSISGAPLSARVEISGHDYDSSHVYSNLPIGNYHRYLSPGNYQLTFSKSGYHSKTVIADVYTNTSTVENVMLAPINFVGINEIKESNKVISSYDVLGRKSINHNGLVLKLYENGSVKKTINLNK